MCVSSVKEHVGEQRRTRYGVERATTVVEQDLRGAPRRADREAGAQECVHEGAVPCQAPPRSLRPPLNGEEDVYLQMNCRRKKPQADSPAGRKLLGGSETRQRGHETRLAGKWKPKEQAPEKANL